MQLNWDEKHIRPIEYTRWLFIISLLFPSFVAAVAAVAVVAAGVATIVCIN